MGKLFETCYRCKGSRSGPKGDPCGACRGLGFTETGITVDQVERLVEAERLRQGDPPAVQRAVIEERHRLRNLHSPAFLICELVRIHARSGAIDLGRCVGLGEALDGFEAMVREEAAKNADPSRKSRQVSEGLGAPVPLRPPLPGAKPV